MSRDAFVGNARRECGAFSARQFGDTGISDAITEFVVREMNAKERIGRSGIEFVAQTLNVA
ncbi:MAG: hypothetical protein WBW99_11650, partial [Pseudolabrys sp.]